jgi:hypothetical protein
MDILFVKSNLTGAPLYTSLYMFMAKMRRVEHREYDRSDALRSPTKVTLTLLSQGERRFDASSKGLEFVRASVMVVSAKNTNAMLRIAQCGSMILCTLKQEQ